MPIAIDTRSKPFFKAATTDLVSPIARSAIFLFQYCTSLNYIKMLATDISAGSCLSGWVSGVSATGTFVKSSSATWNKTGSSGVPSGWTVITEENN